MLVASFWWTQQTMEDDHWLIPTNMRSIRSSNACCCRTSASSVHYCHSSRACTTACRASLSVLFTKVHFPSIAVKRRWVLRGTWSQIISRLRSRRTVVWETKLRAYDLLANSRTRNSLGETDKHKNLQRIAHDGTCWGISFITRKRRKREKQSDCNKLKWISMWASSAAYSFRNNEHWVHKNNLESAFPIKACDMTASRETDTHSNNDDPEKAYATLLHNDTIAYSAHIGDFYTGNSRAQICILIGESTKIIK